MQIQCKVHTATNTLRPTSQPPRWHEGVLGAILVKHRLHFCPSKVPTAWTPLAGCE